MTEWKSRWDSSMPYQEWRAFSSTPDDYVEVANAYGDVRRGYVRDFWWGYEQDMGHTAEGVITKARRIEKVRVPAGRNTI